MGKYRGDDAKKTSALEKKCTAHLRHLYTIGTQLRHNLFTQPVTKNSSQ